jgi:DNA repair exonuclease SbcCD ATPase subunit
MITSEARFAKIEALLQVSAERMDRADQRMDREDKRRDLAHKRWERRMQKVDERMDKFDSKLEAIKKLIQYGMKLVSETASEGKKNRAELRELAKAQKAWLDSMRGGNGNGHRRVN